ncbi:MAG: tetratricopeptide repeat protein [Acidithiobacillus ferrivorans]
MKKSIIITSVVLFLAVSINAYAGLPSRPWFPWKPDNLTDRQAFFLAVKASDGYGNFLVLMKGAKEGNTDAMVGLSVYYWRISDHSKKGFLWAKKAATLGNTKAMFEVGNAYLSGHGTIKNEKKAKYWLDRAAKYGYAKMAYWTLGYMYQYETTPANLDKAIECYQKSARDGFSEAATQLVSIYLKENNTKQEKYWENFTPPKLSKNPYHESSAEIYRAAKNGDYKPPQDRYQVKIVHKPSRVNLLGFYINLAYYAIDIFFPLVLFFQIKRTRLHPEGTSLLLWFTLFVYFSIGSYGSWFSIAENKITFLTLIYRVTSPIGMTASFLVLFMAMKGQYKTKAID